MGFIEWLWSIIAERAKSLIGGLLAVFVGSWLLNISDNMYVDLVGLIVFLAGIAAIFYGLGLEEYLKQPR